MKQNFFHNLFNLFILIPIQIILFFKQISFLQINVPSLYHLFNPLWIFKSFYMGITNIRESIIYSISHVFPFIISNLAWLFVGISLILLILAQDPLLIFILFTFWLFQIFRVYFNELIYMGVLEELILPILSIAILDISFPGFSSFSFTPYEDLSNNWVLGIVKY